MDAIPPAAADESHEAFPEEMTFEPELMVRESSGAAKVVAKSRAEAATPAVKAPMKRAKAGLAKG